MKISFAFRTRLIAFPHNKTSLFAMQLLIFYLPFSTETGYQNNALVNRQLKHNTIKEG